MRKSVDVIEALLKKTKENKICNSCKHNLPNWCGRGYMKYNITTSCKYYEKESKNESPSC
ncbi:hypothetical protein FACS189447_07620 [Spirochaetia bacterium]|nr:hypothetical protein FACS189447_07620 [Spirochaetia bacterium]